MANHRGADLRFAMCWDRLTSTDRGHESPRRDRLRAQIALDAAGGYANASVVANVPGPAGSYA
jgi:hypothetical protein